MYDKIIKEYVKKLSIDDIRDFAKKNNIKISIDEADIILYYLKNNWETLYKGDPTNLFMEIKQMINPDAYIKMINLYNEFKKRFI